MRFAMLGIFTLAALGTATTPAHSQTGKLTGVVIDAESGAPLEGVQILLQGTGISALTGANGRYFIVNLPPSNYSVVVRRIGYTATEVRNVSILIDVTRSLDLELSPAGAIGLAESVVTSETVPLVEAGVTGAGNNIQSAEIQALPVSNIQGALALQQGFLEVPQNTDVISFSESRRNAATPVRIRGGRAGETLSLVDGVPINNFVFGGPAFDITTMAIEQVDFQRGGFEPQYGNALSGIINIATREGGTNLAGSFSYQTSAIGGALGSRHDELANYDQIEGYLSGPIPGTGNRLRFMAAGRTSSAADRVIEFDQDVTRASGVRPDKPPYENNPLLFDLYPGWRAFGYDDIEDVTAKLTYYFAPTAKLSISTIRYQRQRLPFDFDWMLTGFFPLDAPAVENIDDSLRAGRGGGIVQRPLRGTSHYYDLVQGSLAAQRNLFVARWDHTLGRWAYKARVGRFDQSRETCSYWQGVCLGDRLSDYSFSEQFVAPISAWYHPTSGTDKIYGGEDLTTTLWGLDIQGQPTDHHHVQFGASYQRHDLTLQEWWDRGGCCVLVVPSSYEATPWDAAAYFQDKIEYDFLTIKLGARFDFGRAGGWFFANPLDPTNGTTARELCDSLPERYTAIGFVPISGWDACSIDPYLMAKATRDAQSDDFVEAGTRTQFSPRIGLSFPVTQRSTVFFNFGRYSQHPLFNHTFINTGAGITAGPEQGICDSTANVPGTNQCYPIVYNEWASTPLVGNPNLLMEKTTAYEVGFATEVAEQYGMQVTAFSKDQFGLTGIRQGGRSATERFFDVGATYGTALYNYNVMVNQDIQTVRGFELQLRRRLFNYWGFSLNLGLSQATTNAPAPELEAQNREDRDPQNLKEVTSEIDIPASFNASLFFRVGNNERPFGIAMLDAIVRNANATVSVSARSGFPYTPTRTVSGFGTEGQLERNSGRSPAVLNINLLLGKDFIVRNLRWGAFLRVTNLLDARNCNQVYASTGDCVGGMTDQDRRRFGGWVGTGASSTSFNRAHYVGQRRALSFGARVSF